MQFVYGKHMFITKGGSFTNIYKYLSTTVENYIHHVSTAPYQTVLTTSCRIQTALKATFQRCYNTQKNACTVSPLTPQKQREKPVTEAFRENLNCCIPITGHKIHPSGKLAITR